MSTPKYAHEYRIEFVGTTWSITRRGDCEADVEQYIRNMHRRLTNPPVIAKIVRID